MPLYLSKTKNVQSLILKKCISFWSASNQSRRCLSSGTTAAHFKSRRNILTSKPSNLIKCSWPLYTKSNNFSSENNYKRVTPLLMKLSPIIWPSIHLSIKNWILKTFVIRPHFDNDFDIRNFMDGAKQALVHVSTLLSEGNLPELKDIFTPETYEEVSRNLPSLNMQERMYLKVDKEDVFFNFPYQIGVIMNDANKTRFVEITVVYHCMFGSGALKPEELSLANMNTHRDKMSIVNYRFIRDYTQGIEDSWHISGVNHFKADNLETA